MNRSIELEPHARSLNILVVDDDHDIVNLLQEVLGILGHRVTTAFHGREALDVLSDDADIDLVIADVRMPELDGLALLKEIRQAYGQLPVAMITGYADLYLALESLKLQTIDFLLKPIGVEQLKSLIHRTLLLKEINPRSGVALGQNLVAIEQRWTMRSDRSAIPGLLRQISSTLYSSISSQAYDLGGVINALAESLNNAVIHGNLGSSQESADHSARQYAELLEERASTPGHFDRMVTVHVTCDSEQLKLSVMDEGDGFAHSRYGKNRAASSLVTGRGIALILHTADEVFWNEKGNEITLIFNSGQ